MTPCSKCSACSISKWMKREAREHSQECGHRKKVSFTVGNRILLLWSPPTTGEVQANDVSTIEVGKAKILLQKIFDELRSEEMYVRFLLLWLLNWTIYSWIKKSKQFSSELFHILKFAAVAGDTLQNWPCPPPLQSIWTPSTILISFTETILFSFVSFVLLRTSSNV